MADIVGAAAAGKIALSGAADLVRLIEVHLKTCEASNRQPPSVAVGWDGSPLTTTALIPEDAEGFDAS
jgi:hypothetical protein